MGAPRIQTPSPVQPVDTTKAMINALNFSETQRRLRQSQGRRSTFLTAGAPRTSRAANTLLGQ